MKLFTTLVDKWNNMVEEKKRQQKADHKRHKSGFARFLAAVWRYHICLKRALVWYL